MGSQNVLSYLNRENEKPCLSQRRSSLLNCFSVHRVRVLGEPDELASLLCTFADARPCERITRQDQCLRPPTARTAAGQRSFAHRAASLLNTVPDNVKRLNPAAFRRAAKTFFSNR